MRTLSSSPCQLGLGVVLRCLSLSSYIVITKLPDTKLPISRKPLNIIICFNDYHEALFNALLSAINRS